MIETPTHYLAIFKPSHYTPKKELHNTFGGIITESDFCTEYNARESKSSFIAGRIVTAKNFDYQCLNNAKLRERRRK